MIAAGRSAGPGESARALWNCCCNSGSAMSARSSRSRSAGRQLSFQIIEELFGRQSEAKLGGACDSSRDSAGAPGAVEIFTHSPYNTRLVPDPDATPPTATRRRSWVRWTLIGLGVLLLGLVIFHGPILRAVVHAVAVKVASGQNLKLDLRVEGGVLGGITLRNVHATATGPSAVQSLDADLIHAEYSLPDLAFHGMSDFLKNVEVRDVTAVLDPSKAPIPTPTPPQPNEKVSLPTFFPKRLQLANVNLTLEGPAAGHGDQESEHRPFPGSRRQAADRSPADPRRPQLDRRDRDHDLREQESLSAQPCARSGEQAGDGEHRRVAGRAGEARGAIQGHAERRRSREQDRGHDRGHDLPGEHECPREEHLVRQTRGSISGSRRELSPAMCKMRISI